MTKKTRRKFTAEAKAKAVADYVAGIRTAQQIAKDLNLTDAVTGSTRCHR